MRRGRLGTRAALLLCLSFTAMIAVPLPTRSHSLANAPGIPAGRVVEYRFTDDELDVARHDADLVAVSVRVGHKRLVVTADVLGAGPADEFTFALNDANGGYSYGNIENTGGPDGPFPGCGTAHLRRDRIGGARFRIAADLRCVRGVDLSAVRVTVRLLRAPVYPDPAYDLMDAFVSPWIRLTK